MQINSDKSFAEDVKVQMILSLILKNTGDKFCLIDFSPRMLATCSPLSLKAKDDNEEIDTLGTGKSLVIFPVGRA